MGTSIEGKIKLYLIYCSTGCTCCSYENHYRGPYKTMDDARRRIDYFNSPGSKFWPVGSKYAVRGRYEVEEVKIEVLSDGRCIVDGERVIESLNIIEVNEDGSIKDDGSEFFSKD